MGRSTLKESRRKGVRRRPTTTRQDPGLHHPHWTHVPQSVTGSHIHANPSLVRVLGDDLADGRRFVHHQTFDEVFLQCVRQGHQDNGMVEDCSP